MRKAELLAAVRGLLPPGTTWPDNQGDVQLEGGRTVLMLVATMPDAHLAVKLIDFVCPLTTNFWASDQCGRHVIMDACHRGVHPSVLLRLMKWARKCSLSVVVPMARLDVRGQDAVELAIQGGHSELASCLLEQRDPTWHHVSLCNHYPLEVLELAIESGNAQCAKEVLTNKRVVRHLQPGMAARLNLTMRWMQRQISKKRLFNIFTCVGAAVRCNMPGIVEAIDQLNPSETRQAVWYAVCKAQTSGTPAEVDPELVQMANSYLLDKLWPQLSVIVMLRHWELLAANERSRTRWERLWQSHRDWEAIASNPWTSLPSETMSKILSFLVPSKSSEMKEMRFLVEY